MQSIAAGASAPKERTRALAEAAVAPTAPVAPSPAPPPAAALQPEGGPVPQAKAEAKSFAPATALQLNGPTNAANAAPEMPATRFHGAPTAFRAGTPAAKAPANESGAGAASQSAETVEMDSAQSRAKPVAPAQPGAISPVAATAVPAAGKSGLVLLPSGLPLVSTAEAGHTQLALDAVGSLFLSRDLGKTWQPVERQWTGRAVKVRLVPVAKAENRPLSEQFEQLKQATPAVATIPAAFFEIVNERNAVWTSADGKTWTAK